LAGLGNSIDGWGESEESSAEAPPADNGVVVDDSAIAENTNTAAPTVNNDKQTTPKVKPDKNSKPAEKTEAQKQQEKLNNLMNQANKAGKGNTNGSGQQGTKDGQIDKNGIFNGGGSAGSGGGEGGGDGDGKGGGKGSGYNHTLKGRKFISNPELTGNSDGLDCKMIISVAVSPQGDVISAEVKDGTCVEYARARDLAIKAVKLAKFSESGSSTPQYGTVTINFDTNK
jgi:outer membrane biosynthesis protein TonB